MINATDHIYATDKEIFDLLMSSGQKTHAHISRQFCRTRGIFFSKGESIESLATYISKLPLTQSDISELVGMREHTRSPERYVSLRFPGKLSKESMAKIINDVTKSGDELETITTPARAGERGALHFEHIKVDYSKTTFLQRQKQEGTIELDYTGSETIVRLPVSPKAQEVAKRLTKSIKDLMQTDVDPIIIDLSKFDSIGITAFFTKLINNIKGHRLETVTSVRTGSVDGNSTTIKTDEDEDEETPSNSVVVESASLNGQNLLYSQQYQDLIRSGFNIVSITWQARQLDKPNHLLQFVASFDPSQVGFSFRYTARYTSGDATPGPGVTFRALPENRKSSVFAIIENAASEVYADIERSSDGDVA